MSEIAACVDSEAPPEVCKCEGVLKLHVYMIPYLLLVAANMCECQEEVYAECAGKAVRAAEVGSGKAV